MKFKWIVILLLPFSLQGQNNSSDNFMIERSLDTSFLGMFCYSNFYNTFDFKRHFGAYYDKDGVIGLDEAQKLNYQPLSQIQSHTKGEIIKNPDYQLWLKLKIGLNAACQSVNLKFYFGTHASIDAYFVSKDSTWEHHAGLFSPFETSDKFTIPFQLQTNQEVDVYVRIKQFLILPNNIQAWASNNYGISHYRQKSINANHGMYWRSIGLFFILVFACSFSFAQYLSNQDKAYAYYTFYLLSLVLYEAKTLYSLSFTAQIVETPGWLLMYGEGILLQMISITYFFFIIDFLELRVKHPNMTKMFYGAIGVALLLILLDVAFIFFKNYEWIQYDYFLGRAIQNAVCIIAFFWLLMRVHSRIGRFVQAGSFCLLAGSLTTLIWGLFYQEKVGMAKLMGINDPVSIGIFLEILFFSMALGYKTMLLKKQHDLALQEGETNLQKIQTLIKDFQLKREEIARDLHDEMGSTLSSISILSESVLRGVQVDSNMKQLETISERAREVMNTMGDIVWSVNLNNDEMASLVLRMREFAVETLEAKDINLYFEITESLQSLKAPVELHKDFYLFFKEAINNAAKYAQAKEVWVKITEQNQEIKLEIRDNGRGFDTQQVRLGNGLQNMQERAQRLKGKFILETKEGQGTSIFLSFPIT